MVIIRMAIAQINIIQYYLRQIGQMINNTPISQIHIIQQHQAKHKRRLERILQSRPASNQYALSKNFKHMLETKKMNHEKWKQHHRNKQKQELTSKNEKIFNKLIDITIGEGPYGQSRTLTASRGFGNPVTADRSSQSLEESVKLRSSQLSSSSRGFRSSSLHHHNYQLLNIRKSKMIDRENPKLAQRIMEKTGDLSYQKDLQQFRKTRQIMFRLQKFRQIQKIMRKSTAKQVRNEQLQFRSKTLPPPCNLKTKRTTKLVPGAEKPMKSEAQKHDIIETRGNPDKQERRKSKSFRSKVEEDRRYRTIQSIREQAENNLSEQFGDQNISK